MSRRPGAGPIEPTFSNVWEETREALERLSFTAGTYYQECKVNPSSAERVSFFLIHVLYQVTLMLIRLSRGNPDEETRHNIENSKELLRRINSRWRLAGKLS